MKCILIFLAIFYSSVSTADTLKDKEEAMALALSIMELVGKGKTEDGLKLAKPYLIIPDHEFEGVLNSLRMQAPAIEQRFGKTLGMEFSQIQEVGESLMLVMYIQKFEKHMMRWKFYFYKPSDGWVLNTFNTDDQIQLMFQGF
ncbi:MAG: hypothetical protein ABJK37_02630 [Paraglaciecola sp.]|uniref:hypothetical protein n=1 Tax=Paraglaciecola sp. TaxID=1920173 RepID=UPI0032994A43